MTQMQIKAQILLVIILFMTSLTSMHLVIHIQMMLSLEIEEFQGNVVEEATPNESTNQHVILRIYISLFLFILVLISLLFKIIWSG